MAVPKEYTNKDINGLRGLRANKDFTKFYYRFKINNKEHTFTIDYACSFDELAFTPVRLGLGISF